MTAAGPRGRGKPPATQTHTHYSSTVFTLTRRGYSERSCARIPRLVSSCMQYRNNATRVSLNIFPRINFRQQGLLVFWSPSQVYTPNMAIRSYRVRWLYTRLSLYAPWPIENSSNRFDLLIFVLPQLMPQLLWLIVEQITPEPRAKMEKIIVTTGLSFHH
jgi:hypothetical protein